MSDAARPSPQKHSTRLIALLFGAAAAPIFWLGQLMLAYAVTAYACYPADHPVMPGRFGVVSAIGNEVAPWCTFSISKTW